MISQSKGGKTPLESFFVVSRDEVKEPELTLDDLIRDLGGITTDGK